MMAHLIFMFLQSKNKMNYIETVVIKDQNIKYDLDMYE